MEKFLSRERMVPDALWVQMNVEEETTEAVHNESAV